MNLVLCLTEQCNLRCTYCYYKESQADRKTVMDDATLEQAIKIALDRTIFFRQSYLNITFFGGEPLLRRDAIYKGVEFAKAVVDDAMDNGKISKNFKLQFAVNTNGTLFDDEFFGFCDCSTMNFLAFASVRNSAFTFRSTGRNTTTILPAAQSAIRVVSRPSKSTFRDS